MTIVIFTRANHLVFSRDMMNTCREKGIHSIEAEMGSVLYHRIAAVALFALIIPAL
jgi:hypothetical protein